MEIKSYITEFNTGNYPTTKEQFKDAAILVNHLRKNSKELQRKLTNNEKLTLYALYKEATIGNCNTPAPYSFNFTKRRMWEEWNSLSLKKEYKNKPPSEARRIAKMAYIKLTREILNKHLSENIILEAENLPYTPSTIRYTKQEKKKIQLN